MTTAASERFECIGGGPADGVRRDSYGRASLHVGVGDGVHQYTLTGRPGAWHYDGRLTDDQAETLDPHRVVPLAALA